MNRKKRFASTALLLTAAILLALCLPGCSGPTAGAPDVPSGTQAPASAAPAGDTAATAEPIADASSGEATGETLLAPKKDLRPDATVSMSVGEGENTYYFLNPLGTVEPRAETPLADRQPVIDILNGTGERTLRLGVAWYYKPLDAEPPYAIAEMLKEKWEKEHPGLTVELVIPDPEAMGIGSELPANDEYIPAVGHAWNIRADIVYDKWAEKVDAIIMGVGD